MSNIHLKCNYCGHQWKQPPRRDWAMDDMDDSCPKCKDSNVVQVKKKDYYGGRKK